MASALQYHELFQSAKDSIFNLENTKAIANLESKFALEKKEKELALLNKDNLLNKMTAEKKAKELEIIKKQAEAQRLEELARTEKDQRKADSLMNLAQKNRLEAQNLQIQKEKQELEILAERESQKRIQNSYLGIFATLLIVLLFIGIGFKQKQAANRKLAAQNAEILNQNEQIKAQKLEIAEKNDSLNVVNEELKQQHEELWVLNENLELQKQTVEMTYLQLKQTSEQLDKSIQYAFHIQSVVMPEEAVLRGFFSDLFIIFRPRDVVSGDFYWFSQISKEHAVFSLADCTGHGVPGAFMSMLGATLLHETVNIKKITDDPARILKNIHQGIRKILKQAEKKNNDGMDISICVFKKNTEKMTAEMIFAGAKSSMCYVTEGEIFEINGNRQYLGGEILKQDFTNFHYILPQNSIFYLYTDGFQDQNNPERKKIGSKTFKDLLLKISVFDFEEQKKNLEKYLLQHQEKSEQRDDISVLGLRI
jgi:serine phosphatase RsbU (regulator of sigma subunit)